jgi:hypothetical protein
MREVRIVALDALRKRLWVGAGVTVVTAALITAHAAEPAAGPAAAAQTTASLTASRFGKGPAENRPAKIVVANANGSGGRVLTTAWFSFVSPDGSHVAVIDSDVNWYTNPRLDLYASGGGAPERVIDVDCISVTWSPDSTKLACVEISATRKPSHLLLIDAASGAKRTLATGFFDSQISFAPDSTRLAYVQLPAQGYFSSRGKLKVIDLATRAATTVRGSAAASPAWGPAAIAFATLKPRGRNYTFDVALIQPDGSGFRQITNFRPDTQLFGPVPVAWSTDGKRLLAGMTGLDAWVARESYAVDPIRGGVRLIAHSVSPAAISRDGRYVVGQTGDAESTGLANSNVVRVPWGGGAKRVLLRQAVEPSFNG